MGSACTILLAAMLFTLACGSTRERPVHFGVIGPPSSPAAFEAGFLPSPSCIVHSAPAFSPDETEVIFSAYFPEERPRLDRIFASQWDGERWTRAEVVPFSGGHDDNWPWFSPDGTRLYFSSRRPPAAGGRPTGEYGLWYVDRSDEGWTEPRQIVVPGDLGRDQGAVYVGADLPGGYGSLDIYRLDFRDGSYGMPENLGPAVNTPKEEYGPCAPRSGEFLVFTRFDEEREPKADLYVCFRMTDGTWSPSRALGPVESAFRGGRFAGLSPDESCLFFVGTGGTWYWVDAAVIDRLRPEP